MKTSIYHERAPEKHKWCLVTYRNVVRYIAVRVDHFDSAEAAQAYIKKIEPQVPLISLGGKPPNSPLPYNQFVNWKERNNFEEYDYRKMYPPGVDNPTETMYTKID